MWVNCGGVMMVYVVSEFLSFISIYWMPPTSNQVCLGIHRYQFIMRCTERGQKMVHADLCEAKSRETPESVVERQTRSADL